jgi:hypothetical protein
VTARLTVDEAAAIARRHPVTVRYALQDKSLHGVQRVKAGRWLIDPECLDAWVDGQQCAHQLAAASVPNLDDRRAARASA